jgi:hypothetical protein
VADQVAVLRRLFPELGEATADEAIAKDKVPEGAEGYFVIPRWQVLGATYNEAVEKVLAKLAKTHHFYNHGADLFGPERLMEGAKKAAAFQHLGEEQSGHQLLVFAGQFGIRHRGRSVRRAKVVMNADEFGLGVYETAIMLLVHPDRLRNGNDLWIDAAGDEYCSEADNQTARAPYFFFSSGWLKFVTSVVSGPLDRHGSVSGFRRSPQ